MGYAQAHYSCDGNRYLNALNGQVSIVSAVKFGEGTTVGGNNKELFLDVYSLKDGTTQRKPLIIIAFGGSFVSGNRTQLGPLCTILAQRGYVVASIDYRLYDLPLEPPPSTAQMLDEVVKAMLDVQAATDFLYDDAVNANTYEIDTNWIIVGGISSGAIATMNFAMLDKSDAIGPGLQAALDANLPLKGITNDNHRTPIAAVLNFSGAMKNAEHIDVNDPPVISFHDDGDEIVPYGRDNIFLNGHKIVLLDGSYMIDSVAKSVGVHTELHTTENSTGHVSYFTSPISVFEVLGKTCEFMYELICDDVLSTQNVVQDLITIYPIPAVSMLHISGANRAIQSIRVLDIAGKNVWSGAYANKTEIEIDIRILQSGFYTVIVQSEGTLYVERFVKK